MTWRGRTARGDVRPPKGHLALGADEVQASEVVALAEGVLSPVGAIDREELLRDDVATVLVMWYVSNV
jgi:hypothetical protein